MNNLLKITAIIGILVIALSMSYYFVIFIPQKENKNIEIQKKEIDLKQKQEEDIESKKNEAREKLETCITNADIAYTDNWNQECESQGLLSKDCIDILKLGLIGYMEKNNISKDNSVTAMKELLDKQNKCSCRLPFENSDRIEAWRKESKDECYKKYQLN